MLSYKSLYDHFEANWSNQFSDIYNILPYLESYPHYLKLMRVKKIHTVETVWDAQKEWIRQVDLLDHPLDKAFFKTHWVPLDQLEYGFFIDLSISTYPVFKFEFVFIKPYRWFKRELSNDITEIMACESIETIDALYSAYQKRWEHVLLPNRRQ